MLSPQLHLFWDWLVHKKRNAGTSVSVFHSVGYGLRQMRSGLNAHKQCFETGVLGIEQNVDDMYLKSNSVHL